MAEDEPSEKGYIKCGWTKAYSNSYYYSTISYSESCDNGQNDACAAAAGGIISVFLLLTALIFAICAVVYVNPFCLIQQRCQGVIYGKLFITTLVLIIIAIIAWFALSSSWCHGDLGLGVGSSMVEAIVAAILCAVAVGVLYSA